MRVEPYLNFNGRCEEALQFYTRALGAEVMMMMRMNESPDPHPPGMVPPGSEEKIMHAALRVGDTTVMVSDGGCRGEAHFEGITLSLAVQDEASAQRYFGALADGGEVQMPLGKTFWTPNFGMVKDRFGVSWMINQMD